MVSSGFFIPHGGVLMTVKIIISDVFDGLAQIEPDSVDCVVTSPPYWGLRKYLPEDAVRLRADLTPEEKTYVLSALVGADNK